MKNLIYFFLLISFFSFSQVEKRLALVIGNSNYDKGELNNPVNDAELIASTLDSIGFDVLLHTNIERRRDFLSAINEFGTKLPEYDVSFVYYAGHGIQINSENFLLPTKETFKMEIDVEDYGVSVQRILKYIEAKEKEKINILVIDACRDNPFEQSWNTSRSLKGSGLAKLNPPTGSIIAFSTDSGNTAPDGDGENSLYTEALSRNLLKSGVSIEQVFKYVREDVLKATNGIQKPIENNTLIGDEFIINKSELFFLEKEFLKFMYESGGGGLKTTDDLYYKLYEIYTKILKYNKNHYIVEWFEIIKVLKYGKKNDLINYTINYDSFKNKSQDIKNFFSYAELKINTEILQSVKGNVSVSDWCLNNRTDCLSLVKISIEKYNKLLNIHFDNMGYFNKTFNKLSLEESQRHYYLWFFTQKNEIFYDALYLLGEYELGLNFINDQKLYLSEKASDFKNFFNQNPERKNRFSSDLVRLSEARIWTMEKITNEQDMIQNEYRKLYTKYPNNTNLLIDRVYRIMSLFEFELSINLINRIISLSPDDPEPYFLLYYIHNDAKNYSDALININYALERLNNESFYYYITDSIYQLGKDLLNSNGYNQIENEIISEWDLLSFRAELYKKLGNKVMMCQDYSKILENLSFINDKEKFDKYSNVINQECN
jgi:hypothetical protein